MRDCLQSVGVEDFPLSKVADVPVTEKIRTWKLQAFGSQRQYAGNQGYREDPRKSYRYDSKVGNYRQIGVGDLAVVEGPEGLMGLARITEIDTWPGVKVLRRCPECATTAIKRRITKQPEFRCHDGHTFAEPVNDETPVLLLEARFGNSFVDADKAISKQELQEACPRYSDQLSIQEIDLEQIYRPLVLAVPEVGELVQNAAAVSYPDPEESNEDSSNSFSPPVRDTRDVAVRQIRIRRGQRKFRDSLRSRYGDTCMISGCDLVEVVQAAHIDPYQGPASNHVENGLLLRSDLHDLFDLDLLGIEPDTLRVQLNTELSDSVYSQFAGKQLRCPGDLVPSRTALAKRWEDFHSRRSGAG